MAGSFQYFHATPTIGCDFDLPQYGIVLGMDVVLPDAQMPPCPAVQRNR
jgi:hypothetical protein